MATILIEYDAKNSTAKSIIDILKKTGFFKMKPILTNKKGLDEAIEDIKAGRIYSAENSKDLIAKCLK